MIAMTVGDNNEVQLRKIDTFHICVLFKNFRVVAGIEKDALSALFNQCSIAPVLLQGWIFPKRIVQNGDLSLIITDS